MPVLARERGHDAEAPPAGRTPTTQNAEHAQGAPAFLDLWRANPLGQSFGAEAAERVAIHHRLALDLVEMIGHIGVVAAAGLPPANAISDA